MSKHFFNQLETGPHIYSDGDSIYFIDTNGVTQLTTELSDAGSALIVKDHRSGGTSILKSGKASEVFGEFTKISDELKARPRLHPLKKLFYATTSVAAISVTLSLFVFILEASEIRSVALSPELTQVEPAYAPYLPEDETLAGGGMPLQNPQLSNQQADPVDDLRVVTRPDFLKPAPTETQPSEARTNDSAAVAEDAAGLTDVVGSLKLPSFSPELYSTTATENPKETSSVETANTEPPRDDISEPAKSSENSNDTAPQSTQTPQPTLETQATSTNESEDIDSGDFKDDASAVIKKMVENGMTQEQIGDLLISIQSINSSGDEITPEMLQGLPEDVVALLINQSPEIQEQGGEMRILPTEVVDQFRGPDGIATIPENYSWYARSGGPVTIPLPGGGDIKTPEDLIEFGLKP